MHLKIILRQVININKKLIIIINEVIIVNLDLNDYKEEKVFLYISLIKHYNMILNIL